jgi:conjugal transfer pilus assembly protein TraB
MLENVKLKLMAMGPDTRRKMLMAGGIGILVMVAIAYVTMSPAPKPVKRHHAYSKDEASILAGKPTAQVGLEANEAKIAKLEDEIKDLKGMFKRGRPVFDQVGVEDGSNPANKPAGKIDGHEEESDKNEVDAGPSETGFNPPSFKREAKKPVLGNVVDKNVSPVQRVKESPQVTPNVDVKEKPAQTRPKATVINEDEGSGNNIADTTEEKPAPRKIKNFSDKDNQSSASTSVEGKNVGGTVTLPAGSMITGVVIAGMDAPTKQHAKNDPTPALIRIKDLGILPNFWKVDLKECFIVAAGYGELSSERVMLRSEAISCVREDGSLLEAPLTAYSTGEDGKAGTRGRVVQRTGSLMANSMMAGFVAGLAQLGAPQRVVPISNGNNPSGWSSPDIESALQGSLLGGAANAAAQVAQYYTQMAQEMYPVVELDAGRSVTFIVNKTSRMSNTAAINLNQNKQGAGNVVPFNGMKPMGNAAMQRNSPMGAMYNNKQNIPLNGVNY